ncbi:phosphatase PAP2 family protein [Lactococcus lactis]|jgi:undecaprenyl-diphosphatase|uniref:Phosphatase PAP2 family protein n=4 Tax=Lactococcus lactis TaxID=1358 RepID=A0A552Z5G2_9LACT|nr:phosphatase PAP2 family protein [Lactococcus lactis]KLK96386.1 Membrane-associated phospholipid phosphatase,PAP2 superfamily [Lactococcus lactis subsp. lactis]KST84407.1 Membrane-associated phospholipid phosphatase [Lactococcus lactis subsp. lactis]KSU01113.1 Membrane-associated phospholipid phosphatase [Lactococcus lactis subsp. lactis]KSU19791.1 Membrane-associated phospholipid phosphatase [Lactococcus lactis subsp. lactis]MBK5075324.1 phosphatase PAP2 family protein [Lactococcus lactis]
MNKKIYYISGAITTLAFLILALFVKIDFTHGPFPFDRPIQTWAFHLQSSSGLTYFFSHMTNIFGDKGGIIVAVLLALVLYLLFKQKEATIWFAATVVLSLALNTVIKVIIGRERPDIHRLAAFANEAGKSFPSGHSIFATIIFGSIFFICLGKLKNRSSKILLGILCIILIALVMFSRIFVGVHYPSDTIGGFLEGISILLLTYPTYIKYQEKSKKTN